MSDESTTNVPGRVCQQHCGHDPVFYRLNDDPRAVDENKSGPMCWYEDLDGFCGHRCPRVCQRGVDGSAGCGHFEAAFDSSLNECTCSWKEGYPHPINVVCGHRCDFSPSPPTDASEPHRCNGVNGGERHGTQNKCTICGEYRNGWFDAGGMEMLAPPPIGDGTHEFKQGVIPGVCNLAFCGESRSAPVHKVSEQSCPGCEAAHAGVQGWADRHTEQCKADHASPTVEPPARVWIKMYSHRAAVVKGSPDPEGVEYAHLEPIRAAIDKCENIGQPNTDVVVIERTLWVALVKSVKGHE